MLGDLGLTLDAFIVFWGDGRRGRGCEEPICHLDFEAKVPDFLCLGLARTNTV